MDPQVLWNNIKEMLVLGEENFLGEEERDLLVEYLQDLAQWVALRGFTPKP